jgi:hypothetical protein
VHHVVLVVGVPLAVTAGKVGQFLPGEQHGGDKGELLAHLAAPTGMGPNNVEY